MAKRKFNVQLYSDRGFLIESWAGVVDVRPSVPGVPAWAILDVDEEGMQYTKAFVCGGIIVATACPPTE